MINLPSTEMSEIAGIEIEIDKDKEKGTESLKKIIEIETTSMKIGEMAKTETDPEKSIVMTKKILKKILNKPITPSCYPKKSQCHQSKSLCHQFLDKDVEDSVLAHH